MGRPDASSLRSWIASAERTYDEIAELTVRIRGDRAGADDRTRGADRWSRHIGSNTGKLSGIRFR